MQQRLRALQLNQEARVAVALKMKKDIAAMNKAITEQASQSADNAISPDVGAALTGTVID